MFAIIERLLKRRRSAPARGLVMGRRIEPHAHGFTICLDLQVDHMGRTYQASARQGQQFSTSREAQQALERWPIGSYCRIQVSANDPFNVALPGAGG